MTSRLFKTLLLGTTLITIGCASTATGKKQSAFVSKKPVAAQKLTAETPDGSILAVVRYPAVVDKGAKEEFRKAYMNSPMGGQLQEAIEDKAQAHNVIDSTIVKSNYFALSLYKELVARLPEHSVLLSPHEIKLAPDGKLTSEPITQAESLPSVVTIDFATYSFPDPSKMMSKKPLTFGDLITPVVSVKTDHRAAVPTHGVLLATQPLTQAAVGNGYDTVKADLSELQSGRFKTTVPELDFISLLSNDPKKAAKTQALSMNAQKNEVQVAPLEKIRMDGDTILALDKGKNQGDIDPLKPVFSEAFANRVINIINDNASEKTAMARRASSIATYDPSLAALTFVGSDSPDYQARYNYVSRMLDAEKKYLSVQSLRLFDGVHNGEMGAQVRDMLKAEYAIIEKRRELARKQNKETAGAVLGGLLAIGLLATTGNSTSDPCASVRNRSYPSRMSQNQAIRQCYSQYERRLEDYCRTEVRRQRYNSYRDCYYDNHYRHKQSAASRMKRELATKVVIPAAIYSGTSAITHRDQSIAVGENYLSSIVPALEQQTAVQVSLIDSNETITAIRFDDLKEKLQTLYLEKQRSLDVIASNCGFKDDGTASGTWLGVCNDGIANGSGVGVIKKADGSAVEYFGNAANGIPNGPGYMIVHEASGSYALEGNFSGGKANGVMRVSKAGKPDQLRTYTNGQDTGSAPSNAVVASPFKGLNSGA